MQAEVHEICWLSVEDAMGKMCYQNDKKILYGLVNYLELQLAKLNKH